MRAIKPMPCNRATPVRGKAAGIAACCMALLAITGAATAATPDVKLGLGGYFSRLKSGDGPLPVAEFVTGEAAGRAAPTNQWYSSVMFQRWSQPLHAHPMTYRATEQGFELGLPSKRFADIGGSLELSYPHVPAIVVSPVSFTPKDARLSKFSDWLAQVSMAASPDEALTATVLHGSPFSFYELSKGDVRFRLAARDGVIADPTQAGQDPRVAAVTIAGKAYAIFAPTGSSWEWKQPTELVLRLPANARYFSVAGLPDASASTLKDFHAVAYAFPTDTRVEWSYDEATSKVRSVYRVQTTAREGENLSTLMGLYPHHWSAVVPQPASQHGYDTVRGRIRLVPGNSFTLERTYYGFVPMWPALQDPANKDSVGSLLVGDMAKAPQMYNKMGRGTYWIGKGLGANAQLLSIAEVEGKAKMSDQLLAQLKDRLESWFDGERSTYFAQDSTLGTFVGVPQEYDSIKAMNDHHFHYGYWVMAAAHVALRDPAWAAQQNWGGMVGKVIADIATDERGRRDFPFLRNFDAYEGHSWASGDANFDAGNNQESSSEAVNAWAGLVLWGEATGDRRLRDLGMFLLTSEVASVNQYWFDLDRQVLAPEYGKPFASMVFGGKYAYNTWWTQEPRQIFGINMLPMTTASTYLGADPKYVTSLVAALPAAVKAYEARGGDDGTPADIWQDVIASYAALGDPEAGAALWNRKGSVEGGETRSHTAFWLASLKEMGTPDFTVTADTPLYAVFKDKGGARTYLAYNARSTPLQVKFSTGTSIEVPPKTLVRTR
jgi:endoglucanase Acf2